MKLNMLTARTATDIPIWHQIFNDITAHNCTAKPEPSCQKIKMWQICA